MRSSPPLGRAVLAALALIALAAVLRGVAWAAALPPWQGPDEPDHYTYVERLAGAEFPPLQRGDELVLSPALEWSLAATAFERFRDRTLDRPHSPRLQNELPRERAGASTAGNGAGGATLYPPLYYLAVLPLYTLPDLDTATARLYAVRAGSALIAALLVVATFLLVLEATGRPGLALAGGLLVGLPPLVGQASGIANPDVLLAAGVAGLGWATLRLLRNPGSRAAVAHASGWLALVALTKPVGVAVAACVVAALLLTPALLASRRLAALATGAVSAAGILAVLVALAGGERIRSPLGFAGRYLWDFYRPRLPALTAESEPSRAWTVWIESGVGGFGWHSVWLPGWVYTLAALTLLAVFAGSVAGLVRDRRPLPFVAACAAAIAAYVLAVHAAEVDLLLVGEQRLLQGRYLIPVAPLATAGFLAAAGGLPRLPRYLAVGGTCTFCAFLALAGLASTVDYFAT